MERNKGFILLSRTITDSEIFSKPPLYLKVWLFILCAVQHKSYRGLERGQAFLSIKDIQEGCVHYVGYRKETPTKDQIYNVLSWLRSGGEGVDEEGTKAPMITTTKTTRGMVITVCKYGLYQSFETYESNSENNAEDVTDTTRKPNTPDTINKHVKHVINDNKKIGVREDDLPDRSPEKPANNSTVKFSDALEQQFGLYLMCRQQNNKNVPLLPEQIQLLRADLLELAATDPERIAIVNKAITGNWKNFYPVKKKSEKAAVGNKFNNFQQRDYDYDALERGLLDANVKT